MAGTTQSAPWANRLAVFDLETTGVDTSDARIVTAFVGVLDADGELADRRAWLVDPGVPIPEAAARIHGVTSARAQAEGEHAPTAIVEIVETLAQLLGGGVPVVAFNAAYDFTVLDREARRHGIAPLDRPSPVVDPMVIDRHIDKFRRGKRTLDVTASHYGVLLEGWHDASADAIAAGRLAQAMSSAAPELDCTAADLHESQQQWAREQALSFAAYMQRKDPGFVAELGWPVREGR